jgi:hypothetical protein
MWFGKKTPPAPAVQGAPPPWENIDQSSKKAPKPRYGLTEFTRAVTGFGNFGAKLLLFGFAISISFISYIVYVSSQQKPPPPPRVDRPAMDAMATTTYRAP